MRVAARCVNSDVKTMCSTTAATRVAARQRAVCERGLSGKTTFGQSLQSGLIRRVRTGIASGIKSWGHHLSAHLQYAITVILSAGVQWT